MHYRKYRLALAFLVAFIVGSAANLWYIWVSAAVNNEQTVSFTINAFHEMGLEAVMLCFFFIVLGWSLIRWKEFMQLLRIIEKEELRKRGWWE